MGQVKDSNKNTSTAELAQNLAANRWLVKAGGRVLGPFNRDEVVRKLKSKELVLLDEVAQPFCRWRYVRDEGEFARVVENLRMSAYAGREDTQPSMMVTQTGSGTETASVSLDDFSRTDKLDSDAHFRDADLTDKIDPPKDFEQHRASEAPVTFGFTGDREIQKRVKKSTKFIWPFTFLLVVVFGLFFYIKHTQKVAPKGGGFNAQLKNGIDAKRVGDWMAAAAALKAARALRPDDVGVNLLLAPILIIKKGEVVEGTRYLQDVLPAVFNPMEISRAKTALAYAAILDSDYNHALSLLTDALNSQPDFYPALADTAVVAFLQKDEVTAQQYFKSAIQQQPQDESLSVMLARTRLRLLVKKPELSLYREIESGLQPVLSGYDYRQEAALLGAYAATVMGRLTKAKALVETLLDSDPMLTANHVHEILVDRSPVSWKALAPICSKVILSLKSTVDASLLDGFCLFKKQDLVSAKSALGDAIKRAPSRALVRAVTAALLLNAGQTDEAQASINTMTPAQLSSIPLALEVAARGCEKSGDLTCAEKYWKRMLKMEPKSIVALAGLGETKLHEGDNSEAESLAAQGLNLSPNFAPLIKLQDQARAGANQ